MGKAYGFDESLLIGFPSALSKNRENRSSFDGMVLQAFETQVLTKLAELDKNIAEEMPGREARAAVVDSARASHEAVRERHLASLAALSAAQAALQEGERGAREAHKTCQRFGAELQGFAVELEHAEMELAAFRRGPLTAYDDLRAGCADSHGPFLADVFESASDASGQEGEGGTNGAANARARDDDAVMAAQEGTGDTRDASGTQAGDDDALMATQVDSRDSPELETQPDDARPQSSAPEQAPEEGVYGTTDEVGAAEDTGGASMEADAGGALASTAQAVEDGPASANPGAPLESGGAAEAAEESPEDSRENAAEAADECVGGADEPHEVPVGEAQEAEEEAAQEELDEEAQEEEPEES